MVAFLNSGFRLCVRAGQGKVSYSEDKPIEEIRKDTKEAFEKARAECLKCEELEQGAEELFDLSYRIAGDVCKELDCSPRVKGRVAGIVFKRLAKEKAESLLKEVNRGRESHMSSA